MDTPYNYKQIRNKVINLVYRACNNKKNKFQSRTWECHIMPVVKHSLQLGELLKADLEILELAAYLHDIASITDANYVEKHHTYGAQMAKQILRKLNYPEDKIKKVTECILTHRGSIKTRRDTLEAKILASADAMSHFSKLVEMFYLAFKIHGYTTKQGVPWLKGKLERSWDKIMPVGRKLIKKDYKIAMYLLNQAIKNDL